MNLNEKIDHMRDDVRQLVKILLDVGSDEGAQLAAYVNVVMGQVRDQVSEDGYSECAWNPLPRDAQSEGEQHG